MAPKLRDSGDPGEWLRHARSNLSRCRAPQDYEEALKTAEAVFAWAESVVAKPPDRAV